MHPADQSGAHSCLSLREHILHILNRCVRILQRFQGGRRQRNDAELDIAGAVEAIKANVSISDHRVQRRTLRVAVQVMISEKIEFRLRVQRVE